MDQNPQNTNSSQSDKTLWLAKQVFEAFPREVTGLKCTTLDCGCIYLQRVFRDGEVDSDIGIYRNSEDGPCDICMNLEKDWEGRVLDDSVVYNSKFQIE